MQKLLIFLVCVGFCLTSYEQTKGYQGDISYKLDSIPTNSEGLLTLTVKNTSIIIDANIGARITSLKLDGKEFLSLKENHPQYYGSTLWMSPQGKWSGNGLQEVLDASEYHSVFSDGTNLHLQSEPDSLSGFAFSKQFYGHPTDTSLLIRYTIMNVSNGTKEVAPWEVTRVPTGGLAFFPKGIHPPLSKSNLSIRDSIGVIWYPYDSSALSKQKLFVNGSEGWLAYVRDGMIFIKQFPDIMSEEVAPGEEEIEIYVDKDKTYIELENQGSYRRILPKGSLAYEVKWYIRHLPKDIKIEIGNKVLIKYVRSIINKQLF